jgi:hypothetical protein
MGCNKIICDDRETMAWLFHVSWSHELWPENGMNQAELSTAFNQKTLVCFMT